MGILGFILPEVAALLKAYVKNPQALAKFAADLAAIRDDINVILAGVQ